VIVLDEGCFAIDRKILNINILIQLIESRHSNVEIVITGRNAPKQLLEQADIVTEMTEVKHYFHKKVAAREGIEK
jgi:cob(I)alamin adenosyltransferase